MLLLLCLIITIDEGEGSYGMAGIVHDILIVDNKDCKSLFGDGYTTTISGVYTVNPDGVTPFQVS